MTPGAAAVRGFLFGAAGILLVGAILGGFFRAGFDQPAENFTDGAVFLGVAWLFFFGLPAGVIGAFASVLVYSPRGKPEVDPGHKLKLRPLDD